MSLNVNGKQSHGLSGKELYHLQIGGGTVFLRKLTFRRLYNPSPTGKGDRYETITNRPISCNGWIS